MKGFILTVLTIAVVLSGINNSCLKLKDPSVYQTLEGFKEWTSPNLDSNDLPASFFWGDKDGTNFLT